LSDTEQTIDNVFSVLSLPGRLAGTLIDDVTSALRPEHTISEENTQYDGLGTVLLIVVAGALVGGALYVWGR
jgi:hypothetical protein